MSKAEGLGYLNAGLSCFFSWGCGEMRDLRCGLCELACRSRDLACGLRDLACSPDMPDRSLELAFSWPVMLGWSLDFECTSPDLTDGSPDSRPYSPESIHPPQHTKKKLTTAPRCVSASFLS